MRASCNALPAKSIKQVQTLAMKPSIFLPLFRSISPVLLLLTISSMRAYTQELPPRWSLGMAAGPAFPVGNFHHFIATDGSAVSAQSGGTVELSGALRVWRALCATLVIEGQENSGTGVNYWFIPPGTGKPIGSSKGNDWKIARVLAGATYTWPLTKKTGPALLIRLLGGIQQTISPDNKEALLSPAYPDGVLVAGPLRTTSGAAGTVAYPGLTFPWSFSYEADAGLQWRFRGRLSAIGYAGYEGSKPSMNLAYINSVNYTTNAYTTDHRRSTYATGTISLRAGVQYALTR
jgi:hypothetical protein